MSAAFPDLGALKAGDMAAWNQAFRHLWPMALRAAHHPEACLVAWEAEDVAHESILELISQIDAVTDVNEMKALVITIAFRRAISMARRKSAIKRRRPDNDESFPRDADASSATELTDIERREMIGLLSRALASLDEQTRLFLKEKIELNLTYNEISLRHGVPLGTVCIKVARGLKKIRAHLQQTPELMKELSEYLR
jgi:RNA polymerase sigma factor (sigma-70 family)